MSIEHGLAVSRTGASIHPRPSDGTRARASP